MMLKKGHIKLALPIFLLLLLPVFLSFNEYYILLTTFVLLYAVVATAWNIIGGMAGQLDLAAATYLGLGAYTCGMLIICWDIPFWIGMPLSGFVALGVAIAIGFPSFQFGLREVWYALASVASVIIFRFLFLLWIGPYERYIPRHEFSLLYMRFGTYIPFFYSLFAFLMLTLLINHRIAKSKFGHELRAIREDETAAEAFGINVRMNKLKALMIYSFITGVIGAFYANILGFLHPDHFDLFFSVMIVVICIVGGLGIIYGPAIAAFLLVGGREVARVHFGEIAGMPYVVFGLILIAVVLFKPEGIGKTCKNIYEKIFRRIGI
jgi:branched-chain amino acid transport system permease protein